MYLSKFDYEKWNEIEHAWRVRVRGTWISRPEGKVVVEICVHNGRTRGFSC